MMGRIAVAGLMLCAMGALVRGAEQVPLLTQDELKKLVDSGQYKDALKGMIRVMELKGAAAAPYNRHDLLMLKAECQLQIKETRAAMDTLELARKEAVAESNDAHAAQAQALVLLIQKSPGLMYTPKTGTARKPIPILDRILRKAAYDALFADDMAALELKVKAAVAGKSLVPIAEASKLLSGLRAVEFVSAGDNKQTEQITGDLTKRSLKLFGDALDDLTAQTQRISDSANRVVTENVNVTSGGQTFMQTQTHRKGLAGQDAASLKAIKAECEKIPAAAWELAQALGADTAPFKAVAAKADSLKDKANTVLTDDYLSVVH